jgi:hypothetical protein
MSSISPPPANGVGCEATWPQSELRDSSCRVAGFVVQSDDASGGGYPFVYFFAVWLGHSVRTSG